MEQLGPVDDLRKRVSEIRVRLETLRKEIETLERVSREYHVALQGRASLWRRVLGQCIDATLRSYWERHVILQNEQSELEQENAYLETELEHAQNVKKRYIEAKLGRNATDAAIRAIVKKRDEFCTATIKNLEGEFDRKNFHIQPKDYRRGNAIDNYFRKIEDVVFEAFNHCCVMCGTTHDLTFDHYGLSKNEGGNFALILADKTSIRLNIVILCRGCNSSKAQRGHLLLFDDAQRNTVVSSHRELLEHLLGDRVFLALIDKWGR